MTRVDREALRRAIKLTRAEDAVRDAQIARKFAEAEPWEKIGTFCTYHQQANALSLKPWQSPPCWLGDEPGDEHPHRGRVAAWELRRRLIASGLSAFEPDPIRALYEAEEAAKQTA
jgi:hypothetical protein